LDPFIMICRPRAQGRQLLTREALYRPLVGGAVDALIGDLETPAFEPVVELLPRREAPARQGVAFDVLDAVLDLALGAGSIRLTGPRGEAVVAGKVFELRMPQHFVSTG